eukprot:982518-Amphidinium_carterae.1
MLHGERPTPPPPAIHHVKQACAHRQGASQHGIEVTCHIYTRNINDYLTDLSFCESIKLRIPATHYRQRFPGCLYRYSPGSRISLPT